MEKKSIFNYLIIYFSVGKNTLINIYLKNKLPEENSKANEFANANFMSKIKKKNEYANFHMFFWMCSNSNIIETPKTFFKDSYCLVYVFDLSNIDTLYELKKVLEILNNSQDYLKVLEQDFPIFIIGNKSDIKDNNINITKEEIMQLCSPIQSLKFVEYYEISAKNFDKVKEVFEIIENKTYEYYNYFHDRLHPFLF